MDVDKFSFESRTDAKLYDRLYQLYKDDLASERSLVFVEVGRMSESGKEKNAGCDQVKKLVKNLVDGGNQSVFGLVDWDGDNQPSERVHVLSPSLRDGIESLLFDPVLITAAVAHENLKYAREKGIVDRHHSYTSFQNWAETDWQNSINVVQKFVVPNCSNPDQTLDVTYKSGMKLQVWKEYLYLDDHELENSIMKAFPFLKPKNNNAGALMAFIVETVLQDHRELLPADMLDTFQHLLEN